MRVKVNLPPMLRPGGPAKFVRAVVLRAYPGIGRAIVRAAKDRAQYVKDLGGYRRGFFYRVDTDTTRLIVQNMFHHAKFVEGAIGSMWGRNPKRRMPPYNALEPWVIRHFGTPGPTWAICRKIAEEGIPARKALLAESLETDVHTAIDNAVAEALDRLLR